MKRIVAVLVGLAAVGLTWVGVSQVAEATINPDTNQVSYWCPNGGVKYEDPGTPFTVPAGNWTLLVLKAGSDQSANPVNEQFPNPVVGQAYSRTDGKSISHAILCYGESTTTTLGTTTTSASTTIATTTTAPTTTAPECDEDECVTTTTAPTTTQPTTTTTATTLPTTTTTVGSCAPLCAGQFGTTTTVAPTTTPTTAASTTSPPTTVPSTTIPDTTAVDQTLPPTSTPTELPHTGSGQTLLLLGLGFALVLAGWVLVSFRRATR